MCQKNRYFFMGIAFLVVMFMVTGVVGQVKAAGKYPSRPIDIICPYSPGGATDTTSRFTADYLRKKFKVPIRVVNKPGGRTVPACLELYKAKPDGYTLMMDGMGSSSQLPVAVQNVPFKIMDRTFIGTIGKTPCIYIVHPDSPIKSLKDLEAEIKKDPGNFTWTSLGSGMYDYAFRKFCKEIGIDVKTLRPVMVKGGSEATNLTAAQSVKLGFSTFSSGGPSIMAKIVRPLVVTDDKRNPNFPDIPTNVESGYPGAEYFDRYGLIGPPKLPARIVKVWEKPLRDMVNDPEFVSKLAKLGIAPFYLNAAGFRERVLKEMEEIKELWGLK